MDLVCETDRHVRPCREVQLRNKRRKAKRSRNRQCIQPLRKQLKLLIFQVTYSSQEAQLLFLCF